MTVTNTNIGIDSAITRKYTKRQSKWQITAYNCDILLFRNTHLWVMKQERGTAWETSHDDFSGVFYGAAMSFDSFHTVKA